MVKQIINTGAADNDPVADTIRAAFGKVNTNFTDMVASLWDAGTAYAIGAKLIFEGRGYEAIAATAAGESPLTATAKWTALGGSGTDPTKVPLTRTVTAGNGLAGGGDLTTDITLTAKVSADANNAVTLGADQGLYVPSSAAPHDPVTLGAGSAGSLTGQELTIPAAPAAASAVSPASNDATGTVGVAAPYAREDHRHPTQSATATPFTPAGNTSSTTVQAAIEEVQADIDALTLLGASDYISGIADPVAGDGVDGNHFLNVLTGDIFGPKASGAWPAIAVGNIYTYKYRGLYSSTAAYAQHDMVLYNGALYRSNFARTAGTYTAAPFEGTGADSFTRLPGVIRGEFNSDYTYAIGDLVTQKSGTNIGTTLGIYRAVAVHTAGNAPDPAGWAVLAERSLYRGDYGLGLYEIGDVVHYSGVLYRCIVAHGSAVIAGPFVPANWTALGGGDYIDTVNASTLATGQDYVLQIGHTVTFPVATDGKVIRMAPANGDWSTLGATLTPAAGWTIGAGQSAIPATSDTVTFIADAGASNWLVAVGGVTSPSIAAFTGASALVAGTQGTVPAPAAGSQAQFLRGDATWAAISGLPVSRKLLWAQGGLATSEVDAGGNVSFYYGSTASGGQIVAHNKTAAAITLNWQGYTAGPGSLNQKSGSGALPASGNLSIGPSALAVNQHHSHTVNTSEGEIYRVTATSGPGTTGPSGTFVLTVEKL